MSSTTDLIGTRDSRMPETAISPSQGWLDINAHELWAFRDLLYFLVWRDLKVRYKQTTIGIAWAILQPFMTMLVFTLFFGKLAHVRSDGLPYPIFYYCALLPWLYFAGALQNGSNTMIENQRVITKVFFPRLLLPLGAVVSGLVDFAAGFLALLGMMLYYRILPGQSLVVLPLFLLLAVFTATGVALWLAALNAIYRDVRYVLPFVIQIWMFASPVVYPASLVPLHWRWLYGLNPMAGVIEGFRWTLTGRDAPSPILVGFSALSVLLLVASGVAYFQRMEGTIADVV